MPQFANWHRHSYPISYGVALKNRYKLSWYKPRQQNQQGMKIVGNSWDMINVFSFGYIYIYIKHGSTFGSTENRTCCGPTMLSYILWNCFVVIPNRLKIVHRCYQIYQSKCSFLLYEVTKCDIHWCHNRDIIIRDIDYVILWVNSKQL